MKKSEWAELAAAVKHLDDARKALHRASEYRYINDRVAIGDVMRRLYRLQRTMEQ